MRVIDSHTGGEPTRVILEGGPDLGTGPLAERARRLAEDHAPFWRGLASEPRGQAAMVGALLVPPVDAGASAGVIFFDAAAVIGMCGHGTIGLVVTLAHLGRIGPGRHLVETPAGPVIADLHDGNTVTVTNVESRRVGAGVTVEVDGYGTVTGDLAYGGNWFFIVENSPLPVERAAIRPLTDLAAAIRAATAAQGVTGERGEPVDHVVLLAPSPRAGIAARAFTLCPDDTYDRSPCGTGSSARLACLAADGRLAPGEEIVQESVTGSTFRLSFAPGPNGGVLPRITGQAWILADSRMVFQDGDPLRAGFVP